MTLVDLLNLVRKRIVLVIAVPVICAIVMAFASAFMLPATYTATTSMYVLTSESASDSSDLTTAQMVTNDVARILKSDRISRETADMVGLDSISSYSVAVTSENSTRVITLSITGPDAEMCAKIADAMVRDVASVAQEVMNVQSVNTIDAAEVPEHPSGSNRKLYVLIAFFAGLVLTLAVLIAVDAVDTRIRSSEEVSELLGLPVIGRFPQVKGGK